MKQRFDKHKLMHNKQSNMSYWVILLEFKLPHQTWKKTQGYGVHN